MKIQKITLIASLLLVPLLINAQENKSTNQTQQIQIIIDGANVIMNGDTLSKESSAKISTEVNKIINNVLLEEKRNQEAKKAIEQGLNNLSKQILKICPDITKEQLDRLLNNFPKNMLYYYGLPNDIRYYKEVTLTKKGLFRNDKGYYEIQTINTDYKDKIFVLYVESMSDEGWDWWHWILFIGDINTGKFARQDIEQTSLTYTLTSKEEKIIYDSDNNTFKTLK